MGHGRENSAVVKRVRRHASVSVKSGEDIASLRIFCRLDNRVANFQKMESRGWPTRKPGIQFDTSEIELHNSACRWALG
jgi:hypothetical protein